ncbi:hypothetical protein [Marinobacterium mangrovicola]|uniref:Uncharacterized protein n=1 Tax=Marinobacterium mangrovicola TaxID=1476959 RepID=A0A4R1GNK5_9GAMM|nr:hypothetical protein [Marinobacterium mangrovicola]TCK08820.1 hypothetical protein CLV83_0913 [Marinobacterium mangrovicola]
MLTYEECLAMSDLTEEEIDAIAEHEHMDTMIAMALGHYLVTHDGEQKIRQIILDDINEARKAGDSAKERVLRGVLQHFIATHPAHSQRVA